MQAIHYYFIRHGETEANQNKLDGQEKVQGWTDTPLTRVGRAQMADLADHFKNIPLDLAYSSDMPRSQTSAQILLSSQPQGLIATPLKEFREIYYGGMEGQPIEVAWPESLQEMVHHMREEGIPQSQFVPNVIDGISHRDPKGLAEDFMTFWNRLESGMMQVHDEALEYRLDHMKPEINVAIISHHTPISAFLHEVLADFDLADVLDYGHYAHVSYHDGFYELIEWNMS